MEQTRTVRSVQKPGIVGRLDGVIGKDFFPEDLLRHAVTVFQGKLPRIQCPGCLRLDDYDSVNFLLEFFSQLKVVRHFPSDNVGVVDDKHLFAGLDGAEGVVLAGFVSLLKLVGIEVVVA